MKTAFCFVATGLLSVSLFAAPPAQPARPAQPAPSIELGTRIGPVDEDIQKKMVKYIRAQGTLSGQI
ncbi:MAG: hypothetical protein K2P92_06315, partial [Bdellovibrionaceae bacterium]|nr:hypothetical protein [Pseudobdellovibrionaceae bacterium]